MSKETLFESAEFVLAEVAKIRTLYGLKKEIRYAHKREQELHTESVAEHIYAMHCLIDYFLTIEDPEGKWDKLRIHQMAQYHDIDEIETGDVLSYLKTESEQENERSAAEKVINNLPESLQPLVRDILDEYEEQKTPEARFVKAIDKIEPMFHLYDEVGKQTIHKNKTTKEQSDRTKYIYLKDLPKIKLFLDVLNDKFVEGGFFYPEA